MGIVTALCLFNFFFYINYNNVLFNCINFIAITLIIGLFGQLGDFFESYLKRKVNIKDTSSILMGHGGFLDRFDSICFAAPIYYLYILYFIN